MLQRFGIFGIVCINMNIPQKNNSTTPTEINEQVSLGDLLAMRGKPFKDWKEERKYLQKKWGNQGRQINTKKGVNSEYSADTPQK